MTDLSPEVVGRLIELAARVEAAKWPQPDRVLNREVALAVGWARLTPSESRKSYPTWFHPDDVRNGKPVLDSLHGTDVWREPLNYLGSLDAAMTLVPEGAGWCVSANGKVMGETILPQAHVMCFGSKFVSAATPALALTACSLRARAQASGGAGE